jgi:hypothetical protein
MYPGDQTLYRTRMTYDNYSNKVQKSVLGNLVRKSRERHGTASELRALPPREFHPSFPGGVNYHEGKAIFENMQRQEKKRKRNQST